MNILSLVLPTVLSCAAPSGAVSLQSPEVAAATFDAQSSASGPLAARPQGVHLAFDEGWIEFELDVKVAGRYRCELSTADGPDAGSTAWVEDYVENPDGRTYDVTAPMAEMLAGRLDEAERRSHI